MPAFISAEMGNNCLALKTISNILQDYQQKSATNNQNNNPEITKEINFMKFLLKSKFIY